MENGVKGRCAVRAELRLTDDFQGIRRLCLAAGLNDGDFENVLSAIGCFKGSELVGCAVLKKESERYSVDWVAVHESVRRIGIGSMLVDHIESEARGRGASMLWALARTPAFFRRLGYLPAATVGPGGPTMDGCLRCRQFGNGCRPEIVAKRL